MSTFTPSTPIQLQIRKIIFDQYNNVDTKFTNDEIFETIKKGGHLNSVLKSLGLTEKINHVSTAGGALVLYLTGERLPMIKALEEAAIRHRS